MPAALSPDLLEKMDAYWRAANYLTVGQIYLQDNPLLETPLKRPRLLGHWGTTTGLSITLRVKSPTSCVSICRPTRTACSRWPIAVFAAGTTST
jgi:XFP N-terminal domain